MKIKNMCLALFTVLLFCYVNLGSSNNSKEPQKSTPTISSSITPTTVESSICVNNTFCDQENKCARVYTITPSKMLVDDQKYRHVAMIQTKFIGNEFKPNKKQKHETEYTCGFKVPTYESLCNKSGSSQLLFVCEFNNSSEPTNKTSEQDIDVYIRNTIWTEFQANHLLRCATTNCTHLAENGTIKLNPFYQNCAANMTSYDDFMTYGNAPLNSEILTKTHLCVLTIITQTYTPGTNVVNHPIVFAGPAKDDYGEESLLSTDSPFMPNDFRHYRWYAGNETTPGSSIYMCSAADPKEKCNWKDHHIAMENHIRMVNLTKERHLSKLNIVCPSPNDLNFNDSYLVLRNKSCGWDDVKKKEKSFMGVHDNCYCDFNDNCFQLPYVKGCASKIRDVIAEYANLSLPMEIFLICQVLPHYEINGITETFLVHTESRYEKYSNVTCCQNNCIDERALMDKNNAYQVGEIGLNSITF